MKKTWTVVDAQSNQRDDVKRETVYCLHDDNETEVQKDDTIQGETGEALNMLSLAARYRNCPLTTGVSSVTPELQQPFDLTGCY